jgi:23S rRNA pseudouridine1911/1915/1917 synthase
MAYIKHPCVGDQTYGTLRPKANLALERQFLHAYRLELEHPVTGAEMKFVDPPPADLSSRLDALAEFSTGRTPAGDEVTTMLAGGRFP